jgi:hypothetical protein
MLELIDTGLIYRNPKPFLKSIHAWHPTLALLDNGDLLAAFDLAEAISSMDYGTYCSRSTDGGLTWSDPVRFFEDAGDLLVTRIVRISRLADGTLAGAGHRRYNHHPETAGWNPETYGVEQGAWFVMRSEDGAGWTDPEDFEPLIADQPYEMCHAIFESSDGRWLLPTGLLRTWEGGAPHGLKTLALVSHDQGRTWSENLELFEDPDQEVIFHEVSLVELPDGRFLSVAWPFNAVEGKTLMQVPYAIATGGEVTARGSTGIPGETTKLLSLGDGRVLCLMRRTNEAGLWAVLARIQGDAWMNLEEGPMWQGSDSRMLGETDAATELAALHFGFPTLLHLPDGDVLAAFWCREDCIHNIRWLRIRVG